MQQALHIFRKDVRYLQREIIFLLALAVVFGWMYSRGSVAGAVADDLEPLFAAVAGYTIARLIHAEAIPGENQFWITRPYRWSSLLGAKLLFVFVFVNLPVFLAQASILIPAGFPIAAIVPGLLWTQVLILVCVVLPLAMLATLTASMVQFIAAPMGIALTVFGILYFGSWYLMSTPSRMEWLRHALIFATLATIAPLVLYLQYRFRRTQFSQQFAIGVAVCCAIAYVALPWRTLFPIQSHLSKQNLHLRVSRDPQRKFELYPAGEHTVNLSLPITFSGLPEGADVQIENFGVTLEAADGRTTGLSAVGLSLYERRSDTTYSPSRNLHGTAWLDPHFADTERGRPLVLRASFYLTVFGNPRDKTITLHRTPLNIMDGLQCYAGYFNQLECRSPFRWPERIVSQKSAGGGKSALTHLISFSPFPANLQLNPIVRKSTEYYSRDPLPEGRSVTIEVEEPLAYLRRDVEVGDIYLGSH
jgi:hypothetical protein